MSQGTMVRMPLEGSTTSRASKHQKMQAGLSPTTRPRIIPSASLVFSQGSRIMDACPSDFGLEGVLEGQGRTDAHELLHVPGVEDL